MIMALILSAFAVFSGGAAGLGTDGTVYPTTVCVHSKAPASDVYAATQLVEGLNTISERVGFKLLTLTAGASAPPAGCIAVGYGAAIAVGMPPARLHGLGLEGFVVDQSANPSIVVSGGADGVRGTIYGVSHVLRAIGVVFAAFDATTYPPAASLETLPAGLFTNFTPAMEYRSSNGYSANFPEAAAAKLDTMLALNMASAGLDAAHGGNVVYASPPGFVHTSYGCLGASNSRGAPPADLYAAHPEWFWPRDNPTVYGQLCWSNSSLQTFVLETVRKILRTQPHANIVSVSQNDNGHYCQSAAEMAIINAEGTPGGAMFRAINFIADGLKDEFPNVAIDTLAYQWSRPAPKITKPRDNVIIRLCSIECNFGAPLTDPSNAPFQTDIVNWGKLSERIYIWNYVTNFGHYLAPFPDWFSLGPNVQFFHDHGVKGIFQEGSYSGPGGDMSELKTHVLSRMMYDPTQDPVALIDEFLAAYFGKAAAVHVRKYLDTMHASVTATGYYMHENFEPTAAAFMTPDTILTSATAFKDAAAAAAEDERVRVQCASMAVYWAAMPRWNELTLFAKHAQVPWPLEPTLQQAFDAFTAAFNATAKRYGGVAPVFREGAGPGNLTALHEQLFPKCPADWARGDGGCVPACPNGDRAQATLPTAVNASSSYKLPPTLEGAWTASSFPPAWIEFTMPAGTTFGGIMAKVVMDPGGKADHTVSVDGVNVTDWSGAMSSGEMLAFAAGPGHTASPAHTVRVTTTESPSWVAWQYITVFSCP